MNVEVTFECSDITEEHEINEPPKLNDIIPLTRDGITSNYQVIQRIRCGSNYQNAKTFNIEVRKV